MQRQLPRDVKNHILATMSAYGISAMSGNASYNARAELIATVAATATIQG